jgi:hypothetical protein
MTWIVALLLPMMSDELGSCYATNDALGKMSSVVGTFVTATPRVLFLVDEDYIVLAVCVTISVAIPAVLVLVVGGFLTAAPTIDFSDLALVIIVCFLAAGLSARNDGPVIRNLRPFVGWLFATDDNLLACRFLDDDGLRGLIADENGLGG